MAGDNRITTENFLNVNFTEKGGITPGTDDIIGMSCDQVLNRYLVTLSGVTTTGNRIPGQNQITSAAATATVSMACTYSSSALGYAYYTLVLTTVATTTTTVTVSFDLDFLSGSVPSGQSDWRGASVTKIPEIENVVYGAGTIRSYTATVAAGTTTTTFMMKLVNDNWDSPQPYSSFRVRLIAGAGATLSVPNSTVTNGTTFVLTLYGILTTFLTITKISGGRGVSGDMVFFRFVRNDNTGLTNQKDLQYQVTFNTTTSSSSKVFVVTPIVNGSNNNYMTDSYMHNSTRIATAATVTSYASINYARFSVLNQSGSSSGFSCTLSPYKYCSFTNSTYSNTLDSLTPGGHVITLPSFGGYYATLPIPRIIPGTSTLSSSDTFNYKYVAHCPTGNFIRLVSGGATVADLYNGNEYAINSVPFRTVDLTSDPTIYYLGTNGSPGYNVQFLQQDQWLELVPVSTNIVKNALWPSNLGYYGLI